MKSHSDKASIILNFEKINKIKLCLFNVNL